MRDFITSMRAGISFTDDKLLQWRLVAYDDAQVHHQPNRSYVCLPCAKKRCRISRRKASLVSLPCRGTELGQTSALWR